MFPRQEFSRKEGFPHVYAGPLIVTEENLVGNEYEALMTWQFDIFKLDRIVSGW